MFPNDFCPMCLVPHVEHMKPPWTKIWCCGGEVSQREIEERKERIRQVLRLRRSDVELCECKLHAKGFPDLLAPRLLGQRPKCEKAQPRIIVHE